jgi:hypothetical protein
MTGVFTAEEAFDLTNRIRNNTHELAILIRQAREGKAWLALGYDTFYDWTNQEFGWHRSRAYQLLNIATLDEDLRQSVALPETWSLSDRQTRAIIHIGVPQFISTLAAEATPSAEDNARLVAQLITRLGTSSDSTTTQSTSNVTPIVRSAPSVIANGLRNSRTAVHMANSLSQQARMLPQARLVSGSIRPQVIEVLTDAIASANRRLAEFDQALEERMNDEVSDAV